MFLKKAVMKKNIIPAVVFSFMFFNGVFVRSEMMDDPGRIEIISKDLVADAPGELVLRYHAGAAGVPAGYRLWVELPAGWYNTIGCSRVDRILKWQHKDPKKDGYFEVSRVPEGVRIHHETGGMTDIYGVGNRFVQVFSFQILGRAMGPGETMELVFRQLIKAGRPHAPVIGGSGPLRWVAASPEVKLPQFNAVTAQATAGEQGAYKPEEIWLEVAAGPPAMVLVNVPSRAAAGETVPVRVRLLDKNYNFRDQWDGRVEISWTGPAKLVSGPLPGEPPGVAEASLRVTGPGIVRVTARVNGMDEEMSNPVEVTAKKPDYRIFWGDLHSHSQWSHDGMGINPVQYAREASALDFHAITEHIRSTTNAEWEDVLQANLDNNQPGRFITIPATEDSAIHPSGHFNLYFRQDNPPKLIPAQLDGIEQMYGGLHPAVIQHHTGIMWTIDSPLLKWGTPLFAAVGGPHVEWDKHRHVKRQAVEIYSLHGSSEVYDPDDPLSYENCDLVMPVDREEVGACATGLSKKGPHYARDAWAEGLVLGTASGSDDHRAQPGKRGGGLTAVMADELTRDDLLDSIHGRRIYATTGDRIILEFRINGQPMGSVIEPASSITVKIHAIGTAPVALIQLMRYDWETKRWKAVIEERPGTITVDFERAINTPVPAVYYLRLEQEGLVHNRPVRAWSSPIWVGEPPMDRD